LFFSMVRATKLYYKPNSLLRWSNKVRSTVTWLIDRFNLYINIYILAKISLWPLPNICHTWCDTFNNICTFYMHITYTRFITLHTHTHTHTHTHARACVCVCVFWYCAKLCENNGRMINWLWRYYNKISDFTKNCNKV